MEKVYKTGIIFSGGGIRGIAHLGVIKFLEELGVRADVASGSSAGAIVAAFYAGGHSAEAALRFFLKFKPLTWRNYAPKQPGLLAFNDFERGLVDFFPTDDFADLPTPLYVTRTNLETGQGELVDRGPLIKNVLASAALPPLFAPIEIEGNLYADGGLTNNFPIEPLLPICERTLAIYVNPLPVKPRAKLNTMLAVAERAFHISVVNASHLKLDICDLTIIPRQLENYKLMDLGRIPDIFELGYQAARAQQDALSSFFRI